MIIPKYAIEKRRVKPTDIKQHIEQLLKLMNEEYSSWCTQLDPDLFLPYLGNFEQSHKEIFKTMLEEHQENVILLFGT